MAVFAWLLGVSAGAGAAGSLAAETFARDRQTGVWEHLALTALTAEEIVVPRLLSALEVGVLYLPLGGLAAFALVASGGWAASSSEWPRFATVAAIGAFWVAGACAVLGGAAAGARAGLWQHRRGDARGPALLGVLFFEAMATAASVFVSYRSFTPDPVWAGLVPQVAAMEATVRWSTFALFNAAFLAWQWRRLVQSVRYGPGE